MKLFTNMVKRALDRAGWQISRKGILLGAKKHEDACAELEGFYRQLYLPQLPVGNERRHKLMAKLEGTSPGEAMYIMNALHASLKFPGDICEFGIAQGATSTLMANEISPTDKKIWLFDSFEGLPRPTQKDVLIDDIFNLGSMEKYQGVLAHKQHEVIERLNEIHFPFNRVQIVPGFIEKTINKPGLPQQVCFAYVDFDFYEPIKIALKFLDSRMVVGCHIVVDDYGWFSAGAQTAVDEFVAEYKPKWELSLPHKQAAKFAVLKKIA